ncbi:MAG TPA: DnaJ C-terminal domain-containing protein [Pseudomonadales bacterium]
MEFKDYYAILGVDSKAGADEIKKAYRKLARKYHPDVSKEADAEDKFKEVSEAYEVLHDTDKRAEYDQLRQYGGRQQGAGFEPPPGWQSAGDAHFSGDFSDFFNQMFGGAGGFQQRADSGLFRGQDVELEMPLFLEDTLGDISKSVSYRVPVVDAHGRMVYSNKSLKVKIPAGVVDGERIRLKGQGAPGPDGGQPGDLFLHIRLVPHPLFDVDGHDLYITVPVAPWEAALGEKITLPTLTGKIQLRIPPASQGGQKLRIKGKGLAGKGDLYAVLKIVIPERHSAETESLWRQLAEKAAFDPRRQWSQS